MRNEGKMTPLFLPDAATHATANAANNAPDGSSHANDDDADDCQSTSAERSLDRSSLGKNCIWFLLILHACLL